MPKYRVRTAVAGVTALVGGLALVPMGNALADSPTTYRVGNPASCSAVDYTTISAAVAVASPGDTIQVCAGLFAEQVTIDKPGLTLLGAQAGHTAIGRKASVPSSVVSDADGVFVLGGSADDTTIDGFTIQGARNGNADGISDFQGSSGLRLVNNVIQLNSNGINLQNPDGTHPALISRNEFLNNNAGGQPGDNGNTGSGVFISNGPANNTSISGNKFTLDTQTAINFAGDAGRPSTGLSVTGNQSVNDSSFVVATNSSGALIADNTVTTRDDKVPDPYGHGTGILDYGDNSNLRIEHNMLTATGNVEEASGISVSNVAASSTYTTVVGNKVTGYFNDIKVTTGNTTAYVTDNTVKAAANDGLLAQAGTAGIVFTHNTVSGAGLYACQDLTTGSGTAGTANVWRKDTGDTASSPAGICKNTGAV